MNLYDRILFAFDADMAQQVEHVLGKDEVTGSSPVSSSRSDLIVPSRFD